MKNNTFNELEKLWSCIIIKSMWTCLASFLTEVQLYHQLKMAHNTTNDVNSVNCTALCQQPNVSYGTDECHCDIYYTDIVFEFVVYSGLVPTLFGLITLIGVTGNTLVLYVILTKQNMRTVTNLLLLNLAIADLSFVLVCPPFTAYQMALARWPFGDLACKLMHFLINVTAYVTVYTLVAISVLRYMTIVHNTGTRHVRTSRNTVLTILTIWLVFLLLNVPVTLSYGLRNSGNGDDVVCDIVDAKTGKQIFGTFFLFAYLLPLTVIGIFSICILKHIQRHRPSTLAGQRNTRSIQRRQQASRLLILVVVLFSVLWLPVHLHLLLYYYVEWEPESRVYTIFSVLTYCLAYFNSCVNPIIYPCASKDFRDSFREVVSCGHSISHDNCHTMQTIQTVNTEGQTEDPIREKDVHTNLINEDIVNGTKKALLSGEGEYEVVENCADVWRSCHCLYT